MADLPGLRPAGGEPYRAHGGRRIGPPYEVHIEGDGVHWIGGECPCRATPVAHMGFAGVLHRARDGSGFFEAQACQDHGQHDPAPSSVVGVAARDLCAVDGPSTPGRTLTMTETFAEVRAAAARNGLTTVPPPRGER